MCSVYVHADPILYESRTRSLRIGGVLTTIRLENLFWDVLAEIAGKEAKTTNQMIVTLHEELQALSDNISNFTSFLRVCCLRYLSLTKIAETGVNIEGIEKANLSVPTQAVVVALRAAKSGAAH